MLRSVRCRSGRSRGPRAEQPEAAAQAILQLVGREQPEACGGQLDRKREPVEPCADLRHRGRVVVRQVEVRLNLAGALDEQPDGLVLARRSGRERAPAVRERQRRHGEHVLTPHPERLAARDEDRELRAALEQLRDTVGGGHHLLEVVEDQQHAPRPQLLLQRLEQRPVTRTARADSSDDCVEDALGMSRVGEVDEVDAVLEPVYLVRSRLESEPCLADPARAGERHQPHPGRFEQAPDRRELRLAPEELRCLRGQVVRAPTERLQRGKVARESGMHELKEVLGLEQVLEPVLAEVTEPCIRRQPLGREPGGEPRDQNLPAVRGGRDPGGPVHRRAEEIAAPRLGFACVDPHADPQGPGLVPRLVVQRPLGRETGLDAVRRGREHGHQPVSRPLHDSAARPFHRLADDRFVLLDGVLHRLGKLLPQARARLEVGQDERERFERRVSDHGAWLEDTLLAGLAAPYDEPVMTV